MVWKYWQRRGKNANAPHFFGGAGHCCQWCGFGLTIKGDFERVCWRYAPRICGVPPYNFVLIALKDTTFASYAFLEIILAFFILLNWQCAKPFNCVLDRVWGINRNVIGHGIEFVKIEFVKRWILVFWDLN